MSSNARVNLLRAMKEARRSLHPYRTVFSFPFGKGGKLSMELDLSKEDFLAFNNGTLPRATVDQIFRDAERAITPMIEEQHRRAMTRKGS